MNQFWLDVLVNLLANFLAWLILGLIIGAVLFVNARSNRSALFRFFGLDRLEPHVTVYLSTIVVEPGCAKRLDGQVSQIWEGRVTSGGDLNFVAGLPLVFHSTFADNLPAFIRRRISTRFWSFEPVTVEFRLSPDHPSEIASGPVICRAGPNYNLVTKHFLGSSASYIEFLPSHEFRVRRGNNTGRIISPAGTKIGAGATERYDHDLGLLSRLTDHDHKRKVVIIAGTGSQGTMAVADYLSQNWRTLDRTYHDMDFAVVLECPNRRIDPQGHKAAKVVQTFPEIP